jgi:hypothetical protein
MSVWCCNKTKDYLQGSIVCDIIVLMVHWGEETAGEKEGETKGHVLRVCTHFGSTDRCECLKWTVQAAGSGSV